MVKLENVGVWGAGASGLCSAVHRVLSADLTRACACVLRGPRCRFPRTPQKLGCPQGFFSFIFSGRLSTPDISPIPVGALKAALLRCRGWGLLSPRGMPPDPRGSPAAPRHPASRSHPASPRLGAEASPAGNSRGSPRPREEPCVKGLQPGGWQDPAAGNHGWQPPGCNCASSPWGISPPSSPCFVEIANPRMNLSLNKPGEAVGRQGVGCTGPFWVVTGGGKGLGMYGSGWDIPAPPPRTPSIPAVSPSPGEAPQEVFPSVGKALSELQVTPLAGAPCH